MSLTNLIMNLLTSRISKIQIRIWHYLIYYTCKNIKSVYNNNKFKTSAPNWNDEFNLPDGSYSVFDIQNYFEYIIKKHETIDDNPPVQIYVNKIKKQDFSLNKNMI